MSEASETMADLTQKVTAAEAFVKGWAELAISLPGDYDCYMTCTEAELMSDLLAAFGQTEAAELVLQYHTEGDVPGDAHVDDDGNPLSV